MQQLIWTNFCHSYTTDRYLPYTSSSVQPHTQDRGVPYTISFHPDVTQHFLTLLIIHDFLWYSYGNALGRLVHKLTNIHTQRAYVSMYSHPTATEGRESSFATSPPETASAESTSH